MSDEFETAHSLKREAHHSVAEHEILISFNNDSAATAFSDWWQDHGAAEFHKWAQLNKRDYIW
jgi:hypothetical protein